MGIDSPVLLWQDGVYCCSSCQTAAMRGEEAGPRMRFDSSLPVSRKGSFDEQDFMSLETHEPSSSETFESSSPRSYEPSFNSSHDSMSRRGSVPRKTDSHFSDQPSFGSSNDTMSRRGTVDEPSPFTAAVAPEPSFELSDTVDKGPPLEADDCADITKRMSSITTSTEGGFTDTTFAGSDPLSPRYHGSPKSSDMDLKCEDATPPSSLDLPSSDMDLKCEDATPAASLDLPSEPGSPPPSLFSEVSGKTKKVLAKLQAASTSSRSQLQSQLASAAQWMEQTWTVNENDIPRNCREDLMGDGLFYLPGFDSYMPIEGSWSGSSVFSVGWDD